MRIPRSVEAALAGGLAVLLSLTGAAGALGVPEPVQPTADPPPGALALDRVFDVDSAIGDAQVGEYELTLTDGPRQASALWAHQQLDLAQPFHMQAAIHLGDEGADAADGVTFTVQAESPRLLRDRGDRLGIYPQGMSDRERRGVSVELDTYFNGDDGDMFLTAPSDSFAGQHAAVVRHVERIEHRSEQWVRAAENPRGLSDGAWKMLTVSWDPDARSLGFALDRLDGTSILAGQDTIDLRSQVGDHAWWGFTGSTGALGSRNAMRFQELPQAQSQAVSASAATVTAGDQVQLMVEHETLSGRWDERTLVVDLSAFAGALSYVDGSLRVDGAPHTPDIVSGGRVEVHGLGSLAAGDGTLPAHSTVTLNLRGAPRTGTLSRAIEIEAGGADVYAEPFTLHDDLPLTITPVGYGLVYHLVGGAWRDGDVPVPSYTADDEVAVPDPVRPGYTFLGWTVTNTEPGSWTLDTPETGVEVPAGTFGHLAFTAHWSALEHAIGFDLAGGTWADGEPPAATYTVEDEVGVPDPVRPGYAFVGWTVTNTEPGGWTLDAPTTDVVVPTGTVGDLTFTAHWSTVAQSLGFDLAGGAWAAGDEPDDTYTADGEVAIPDPVRPGFTFTGWTVTNTEPDGWGLDAPAPGVIVPVGTVGDLAFTAHWSAVAQAIGFDLAGGSWAAGDQPSGTYTADAEVAVADPVRPGYAFDGWTVRNTEPAGWSLETPATGVIVPVGTVGDLAFTAHWSAVAQAIGFDLAGGSWAEGDQPGDTYTVEDAVALPDPVRPGYAFGGWTVANTEAGGWTVETPATGVAVPVGTVGDLSLTAHWSVLDQAIIYDPAGGVWADGSAAAPSYTVEQRVFVPDPVRPGYAFAGWTVANDHPDGWVLDAPVAAVVVPPGTLGNLTFTAHWSVLDQAITYDLAGGSWAGEEPTGSYTVDDTVVVPDPTRHGHAFRGWTVTNDAVDGWGVDAPERGVVVPVGTVGGLAFTAHWSPLAHAITYDLAGGTWGHGDTPPGGYTTGAEVVVPDPVRAGRVFAGWTATNADLAGWSLTIPATGVLVPAGTVGDLAFTAHWSLAAGPGTEPTPDPEAVPPGTGGPDVLPRTGAPAYLIALTAIGLIVVGTAVHATANRSREEVRAG
jgi:uncharacterized repeat protein (TIGR02543 family)